MSVMQKLIEELMETRGQPIEGVEGPVLAAQVSFQNGSAANGTVRRGSTAGTYVLLTPLLDKRTGQPAGAIEIYFAPDSLQYIGIPMETPERPSIVTPRNASNGNLVLP